MDMISVNASILLVLGCLYFIVSPFTTKKSPVFTDVESMEDEKIRKEELYRALNEIEMDFKMNKLSEEDYLAIKRSYELQVAEIMKNEGRFSGKNNLSKISAVSLKKVEAEIDAELADLRKERRLKS